MKRNVNDPTFYDFREGGKTEVSWQMVHDESYFNAFVRALPDKDRALLADAFFQMDAVKQMMIYLFRENKNTQDFVKANVYENYFNAPYIQRYFEMNGISIPTVEGAKHRLPFILNILDAFGIIEFNGPSKFRILRFPLVKALFEGTDFESTPEEMLLAVKKYYISGVSIPPTLTGELKQMFGADFLTDRYKFMP